MNMDNSSRVHLNNKVMLHLPNVLYFIASIVFFYTQLHIVIEYAWNSKMKLTTVCLCLLCFKMGELIHELIDVRYNNIFSILGAVIAICVIKFSTIPILYFLFSFIFMKIRSNISKYSSKRVKVVGRAVGFILSPFYNSFVYLLCVVLIAVICILSIELKSTAIKYGINRIRNKENATVYLLMAFHHMHYFVYAYSIPIIFSQKNVLPMWAMGIIFYLGWAAYNAYEKIIKPGWHWFIIGHILAAVSLITLYITNSISVSIVAWFMTGLGGGTVYMLNSLVYKKDNNTQKDMLVAEGVGHVIGIALWGIICTSIAANACFLLGAFFAVIVIIISCYATYKAKLLNSGSYFSS